MISIILYERSRMTHRNEVHYVVSAPICICVILLNDMHWCSLPQGLPIQDIPVDLAWISGIEVPVIPGTASR